MIQERLLRKLSIRFDKDFEIQVFCTFFFQSNTVELLPRFVSSCLIAKLWSLQDVIHRSMLLVFEKVAAYVNGLLKLCELI